MAQGPFFRGHRKTRQWSLTQQQSLNPSPPPRTLGVNRTRGPRTHLLALLLLLSIPYPLLLLSTLPLLAFLVPIIALLRARVVQSYQTRRSKPCAGLGLQHPPVPHR